MKIRVFITICIFSSSFSYSQNIRDFSAQTVNSEFVNFSALMGKHVTVIDFWASWCKPCLKAMPQLNSIDDDYAGKGVKVIGINTDGPRSLSKVKPIINTLGINYPILLDLNGQLVNDFNVSALPFLIILDHEGKVVYQHEGYVRGDEREWEAKINELLQL
jgi:thiol-disulfide isomerase/thioredoxin